MYVLFQFTAFLNQAEKTEQVERVARGQPVDIQSVRRDIAAILRIDVNKISVAQDPGTLITITGESRVNNTCTWYAVGDQHGKLVAQPFEIKNQKNEQELKNSLNGSIQHFLSIDGINYHSFFAMSPESGATAQDNAESTDLAATTIKEETGRDLSHGLLTYAFAVAALLTVRPASTTNLTVAYGDRTSSHTEGTRARPRLRRMPKITYVDLTEDQLRSKYEPYVKRKFDGAW